MAKKSRSVSSQWWFLLLVGVSVCETSNIFLVSMDEKKFVCIFCVHTMGGEIEVVDLQASWTVTCFFFNVPRVLVTSMHQFGQCRVMNVS